MKSRLKKKIRKTEELYFHAVLYTPRQVMRSYHFWKKYIKKRKIK